MLIYRHPASTRFAAKWAIWKKITVPTSLVGVFNHSDRKYFITKDVGSGIELVEEYTLLSVAEAAFIGICNDSSADTYLGAGRADITAINLKTHTITGGLVTAR